MRRLKITPTIRCPWELAEHRDPIVDIHQCYDCRFYHGHTTAMTLLDCAFPEGGGGMSEPIGNSEELSEWVINAIKDELERAKRPPGIHHSGSTPKADGYILALKWVLSLRREQG